MTRRECLLWPVAAAAAAPAAVGAAPCWPQWGGPNRDFNIWDSPPLRSSWPAGGPKVVWKREIGDGQSSAAVDNGVLYTMHNRAGNEATIAVDAGTGKTLWEHSTPSTFRSAFQEPGNGPYATPLVLADRIVTAGVTGRIECRARKDGALLWKQNLWLDHQGTRLDYGYASSPIAFRNTVIVPCGGSGRALMAFRQNDGTKVWSKQDYPNVYSSPVLINVGGLDQLIQLMDGHVVGLNPVNGDFQWHIPFQANYSLAVASPLWTGSLLFVSAEYDAGAKAIRLERDGQKVKASEVWAVNRLRLHHGNAIHIDGTVYFTSGGKGSVAILTAADMATGKIHWQDRGVGKATFIWADRKLITLDQDGNLMLAEPSPKGFKIMAKAGLLTNLSWTPPSLVGTRLYLRDRKSLMAVELG
jgi:outer membrane protein assembly factor BamB